MRGEQIPVRRGVGINGEVRVELRELDHMTHHIFDHAAREQRLAAEPGDGESAQSRSPATDQGLGPPYHPRLHPLVAEILVAVDAAEVARLGRQQHEMENLVGEACHNCPGVDGAANRSGHGYISSLQTATHAARERFLAGVTWPQGFEKRTGWMREVTGDAVSTKPWVRRSLRARAERGRTESAGEPRIG